MAIPSPVRTEHTNRAAVRLLEPWVLAPLPAAESAPDGRGASSASVIDVGQRAPRVGLTHNPAQSTLLLLYRAVLKQQLPWLDQFEQRRRPQRLPVILTVAQVQAVLARFSGEHALLARLCSTAPKCGSLRAAHTAAASGIAAQRLNQQVAGQAGGLGEAGDEPRRSGPDRKQ